MEDWISLCFKSGIADWVKEGSSVRTPAWMNAAEKKVWYKGKRYAQKQQGR